MRPSCGSFPSAARNCWGEYSDETLIQRATTDYLTGLKTRRYFEEQLDRELKRAERIDPLALIMIDIDHFKQVNDEHGHLAGDMLLRQVGSILMQDLREIDTVARYGGEEFVLLLPDTTSFGARHLAERLRNRIGGGHLVLGSPETKVRLTISLGVASFPTDAQSNTNLLAAADAALYEAKRIGRNRVVLYPELKSTQERRHEARLRLTLPVRVYGMDVEGNLFEQETTTVDIARGGARLQGITVRRVGSILAIKHQNNRARFRVAWRAAASGPAFGQLGLQLLDEGRNMWENINPPAQA